MANIHSRAMLVSLKLSKWSATKYDKKISIEIAQKHNADSDAGRYNKRLINKGSNSYAELMSAFGELYSAHLFQTLPWSDEGWRLIPNSNYDAYTKTVRGFRSKIESLTEAFIVDYPALRDDVKARVNGMFNPADYPDPVDLKKRFSVRVHFNPVPAGEDFRVDLDTETLAEIAKETEERVEQAVKAAQADSVERIHACVSRIAEKLKDPKGIFRDSLIENARELSEVLTRLNVADDPRLEEIRQRVEDMAQVDPQALRDLDFARKSTAKEADGILAAINAAFGGLTQ